ncbi:hypothetical protein SAMN06297422_101159 [Lachnospiraceae bacterium]|nr:hypothetical protein SAMN06297422_101159 [Lachnospiraceae bacterium]
MTILEEIKNNNIAFVNNENFNGVKKIIVDNYNDEAHFVYELLQNADDAGATRISFDLYEDKLIVKHNGRPFNEDDLVAICRISKGTKSDDYTKIGRFGIGFKSVFVYTNSPKIISGEYSFEIEGLILPQEIQLDIDSKDDTIFILPFNNKKTKDKAFDDISVKLSDLYDESLMFLSNISEIEIIISDRKKTIEKISLESFSFLDDSEFNEIQITINDSDSDEIMVRRYYQMKKNGIELIDQNDDGEDVEVLNQSVMISFPIIDDSITTISDLKEYMYGDEYDSDYYSLMDCFFVFFPTRIDSNFEYIIHAPFVTKSSRDTIAVNNAANTILMQKIGELAADSLLILSKMKKLDADIIDDVFFSYNSANTISRSFEKELEKLLDNNERIIPCSDNRFRDVSNVIFTDLDEIVYNEFLPLFPKEYISEIYECEDDWGVFDYVVEDYYGYTEVSKYYLYLKQIYAIKDLDIKIIMEHTDESFYEMQDEDWLLKFFDCIIEENKYSSGQKKIFGIINVLSDVDLSEIPIIRLSTGKHKSLVNLEKAYLDTGYLDEKLLKNEKVKYLYKDVFGIKEYSAELSEAQDAISNIISAGASGSFNDHIQNLKKILIALDEKKITLEDIEGKSVFMYKNQKNGHITLMDNKASYCGFINKNGIKIDLYVLFNFCDIYLLDQRYWDYFSYNDFIKLGCVTDFVEVDNGAAYIIQKQRRAYGYFYVKQFGNFKCGFNIDGMNKLFEFSTLKKEQSIELAKIVFLYGNNIKGRVIWSSRQDFSNNASIYGDDQVYSAFGLKLINANWLYKKDGTVLRPESASVDDLDSSYQNYLNETVCKALGVKTALSERIAKHNKTLEKEGMFVIPIEEREEYLQWKKQKEEARKQRNKETFSSIEEGFNSLDHDGGIGDTEQFDEYNSVKNPERRKEKLKDEIDGSEPPKKEKVLKSVTKSSISSEEKEFLKMEYKGQCQICDKIILKIDGDRYFEAINLIPTDKLKDEFRKAEYLAWNTLCLCPNCAAEFKYGPKTMNGFTEQVKNAEIEQGSNEGIDIKIEMQGEEKTIKYSPKHLQNLKVAIDYYNGKTKK